MSNMTKELGIDALERTYDALAVAINQAAGSGQEKTNLFLVKLALLNANALADENIFKMNIQAALKDL